LKLNFDQLICGYCRFSRKRWEKYSNFSHTLSGFFFPAQNEFWAEGRREETSDTCPRALTYSTKKMKMVLWLKARAWVVCLFQPCTSFFPSFLEGRRKKKIHGCPRHMIENEIKKYFYFLFNRARD